MATAAQVVAEILDSLAFATGGERQATVRDATLALEAARDRHDLDPAVWVEVERAVSQIRGLRPEPARRVPPFCPVCGQAAEAVTRSDVRRYVAGRPPVVTDARTWWVDHGRGRGCQIDPARARALLPELHA